MLALLGSAAAGCDRGSEQTEPAPPALHLIEVLVTTGVDADGTPTRSRVAADGSTAGVLGSSSIVLRFDRFLDPVSATRQAICLQPTLGRPASYAECDGVDFLSPSYDPVRREVVYRQAAGARLQAQTRYSLTIMRPPDDAYPGFRAFDGALLDRATTFELTTIAADPAAARDELPDVGDRWCSDAPCVARCEHAQSVANCIAACAGDPDACAASCRSTCLERCTPGARSVLAACAVGGCHAPAAAGSGELGAAEGLDLSSPAGIAATAMGRVAHGAQQGEHAARAETRPTRFGRAMPLIAPGSPGNSYLVYKQLLGEAYAASAASPGGDELSRLRAAFAVGMPMPPSPPAWPGLDGLDAELSWIALGASMPACP